MKKDIYRQDARAARKKYFEPNDLLPWRSWRPGGSIE
jgi:hypothetical protein